MIRRLLRAPALLVLAASVVVGACTERLDTAAGCPVLCPGQEIEIFDTLIDPAVVLDTTLAGFPIQGSETPMLLANRGDTVDIRSIIRFDALSRRFQPGSDSVQNVRMIDSATVSIRLIRVPGVPLPTDFSIEAYDVGDTSLVDSLPSALLPLFTPARLLGTLTVTNIGYVDSARVSIPLDSAMMRAIVTDSSRVLRIGLRIQSTVSAAFTITGTEDGDNQPRLRYRVSADTTVLPFNLTPFSSTPTYPINLSGELADYSLIVTAPDIRAPGRFAVGGMPSNRSYLRFEIPKWITDSVAVIRAQLQMVQDPVRGPDAARAYTVRAHVGIAGAAVTNLNRAARLIAPIGYVITDSLYLTPGDSGLKVLEVQALLGAWRTVEGAPDVPRAVVLRADLEGSSPAGLRFFGRDAAPSLRPRLLISYVRNIKFGQP